MARADSQLLRVAEFALWLLEPLLTLLRMIAHYIYSIYCGWKIPGPLSLPLIGNVLGPDALTPKDIMAYGLQTGRTFGKLFCFYLGPLLFVHTADHDDLEMLLSGYKHSKKGFIYIFLHPWLKTGLLTSSGDKWRRRRKILTPAFHFKILDQFVPVFNSCGNEFIRHLAPKADGQVFKVNELVELLTLDVICETAMGVKINAQANSDSSYVRAVRGISKLTVQRMFSPWNYPDFIFYRTPGGKKYKECLKILHGTTDKVIQERRKELYAMGAENLDMTEDEVGLRRRVAFLDLLLLAARDGSLTDQDIREEVDTFMFEGHDTTASAVSFAIMLLSKHPDVQEKVFSELSSTFDTRNPIEPTIQDLSELKYMEMVIKETLRLYPSVPVITRENPENIVLKSGHVAPAGCAISVQPVTMHRAPDVYPDPERFDPERFTPDACAARHPFAYLPFSAGPRNCIGQRFALLEIKCCLAKVVWNYRLLPAPGYEPILTWELTTKSMNGMQVRMEPRTRQPTP